MILPGKQAAEGSRQCPVPSGQRNGQSDVLNGQKPTSAVLGRAAPSCAWHVGTRAKTHTGEQEIHEAGHIPAHLHVELSFHIGKNPAEQSGARRGIYLGFLMDVAQKIVTGGRKTA